LLNNCHQYMEAFLALSKIGGLLVPLNTRLAESELTYILKDSDASILVFGDEFTDLTMSMKKHDLGVRAYLCVGAPPSWALDYEKAIGEVSSLEPEPAEAVEEKIPISSCTHRAPRGLPKGAVLFPSQDFFSTP